jgi:hypothetical protein
MKNPVKFRIRRNVGKTSFLIALVSTPKPVKNKKQNVNTQGKIKKQKQISKNGYTTLRHRLDLDNENPREYHYQTGPMYFVFCRLYPSFPQPPWQCLAPTCHLSTLN